MLKVRMVMRATIKKLRVRSFLLIFLTIINPPAKTKGAMTTVPIHQLAVWFKKRAVMATANAAGLKICLCLMAKIYFEDMAKIPAQPRKIYSLGDSAGVMISAKIKTEI